MIFKTALAANTLRFSHRILSLLLWFHLLIHFFCVLDMHPKFIVHITCSISVGKACISNVFGLFDFSVPPFSSCLFFFFFNLNRWVSSSSRTEKYQFLKFPLFYLWNILQELFYLCFSLIFSTFSFIFSPSLISSVISHQQFSVHQNTDRALVIGGQCLRFPNGCGAWFLMLQVPLFLLIVYVY